jgi:hypothetical protein
MQNCTMVSKAIYPGSSPGTRATQSFLKHIKK